MSAIYEARTMPNAPAQWAVYRRLSGGSLELRFSDLEEEAARIMAAELNRRQLSNREYDRLTGRKHQAAAGKAVPK